MLLPNPFFEASLPLPTKLDKIVSIDRKLIHLCLALANVEWKVECEGVEECRDWKSIRRCNMQKGGMA
jgi:hypothetical protein